MKGSFDPRSFLLQVALGNIRGTVPWLKTGYNPTVGTNEEDMWLGSSTYVWPPLAGTQMEVISTGGGAGNDVAAGSGVQQVQIGYLDTSYNEQSEIVTMTGGVAAPTVAVNIMRVQTFRAYRCGVTNPKAAAGTILLRGVGGGTTYSQIQVGYTRARNQMWCVPNGKLLFVTSLTLSTGSAAAAKSVRFTSKATYDSANARILGANYFMPYTEVQVQDGAIYVPLEAPTRFPATVDIKISVISDSADAVCASVLRGFVQTVGQV